MLVFQEQPLNLLQFMEAGEIFGTMLVQQIEKFVLPDFPMVGCNSTKDLPRKNCKLQLRGENYHTDCSNDLVPPSATNPVAVPIPSLGGDTQFVDVRPTYDDPSTERKAKVVSKRSRHAHESSLSLSSFAKLSPEKMARIPHIQQPLVIRHPVSDRPVLSLITGRMEGMPADEGFTLIYEMYQNAIQPCYEYLHPRRIGDMVIWGNRSVMHQANADYDPDEFRYLYRVMTNGDR